MKKNNWIFIAAGLVSIGAISYFIYRKKSDSKKLKGESKPEPEPTQTNPVVSATTVIPSNDKINYSARGLVHTEKRINDLRKILNDIELKGDKIVYKNDGRDVGKDALSFLWISSYRNIKSLRGGVINDSSLNKETKDYLLNKLSEYDNYVKTIFNPEKYNDKQGWVIEILKKYNDPPNYFYDR